MSKEKNDHEVQGAVGLDSLSDISVELSIVLGRRTLTIKELLKKSKGDFIALDCEFPNIVDILANDKLIARGEIIMDGDKVGVKIIDLVKS